MGSETKLVRTFSVEEALRCVEKEAKLNYAAYLDLVRQCSKTKSLNDAKLVHASLAKLGCYDRDRYFGNVLVQMYGECGNVDSAKMVFDGITKKNIYSWNMMMAAYARNGHLTEAQALFDTMKRKDAASWDTMISAYARTGNVAQAREVFDPMPNRSLLSWNTLLKAYALCGDFELTKGLFNKIPCHDVYTWNTMISAALQCFNKDYAKQLFDSVPERTVVTWSALIAAYAQYGHFKEARGVFEKLPKRSIVCWTSVITAYARNGSIVEARKLFDEIPETDDMAWSTIVAAYAQNGHIQEARRLLRDSPKESKRPWTVLISAYARSRKLEEAVTLFETMPNPDIVAWTAMLGAYGNLKEVRKMFNGLSKRDSVAWTAIIGIHVQSGDVVQAMNLFRLMDMEGFQADKVTFINILDACRLNGKLSEGRHVHNAVVELGLETDITVGTTLFNMYAHFAKLDRARELFDKLKWRDVVSWTAMIVAYAQNGHNNEAIDLFIDMSLEGIPPNDITFVGILSVCSHAGWLERGHQHFVGIGGDYGTPVTCGHYVCMVDLLGRSGRLQEAEELVRTMPFEASEVAWMSLLGACKLHKDSVRALRIAEECNLKKEEVFSKDFPLASCVLLSNIYAETR